MSSTLERGGGGSSRRRPTLSQQMSVIDPTHLRDLLRIKDDENVRDSALAGLTLGAVLGCEEKKSGTAISRTLLDIIKDEESGAAYRGLSLPHNRKNWKHRLRLRRSMSSTSHSSSELRLDDCRIQISRPFPVPSSVSVNPALDPSENVDGDSIPAAIPLVNASDSRGNIVSEYDAVMAANEPILTRLSVALAAERAQQQQQHLRQSSVPASVYASASILGREEHGGSNSGPVVEEALVIAPEQEAAVAEGAATAVVVEEEEAAPPPARVSLMSLLEETDSQGGMFGGGENDDDEDEEEDDDGVEYVCCVCMVRHKGAAFIPCGHTFCRLCSRELWVSRGNCPLCNGFILEILDIF